MDGEEDFEAADILSQLRKELKVTKAINPLATFQEEIPQKVSTPKKSTKKVSVEKTPKKSTKKVSVEKTPKKSTKKVSVEKTPKKSTKKVSVEKTPKKSTKKVSVEKTPKKSTKKSVKENKPSATIAGYEKSKIEDGTYTVEILKQIAKNLNLKVSGKKADLIERILKSH
jgi:outer membrane biosynthesis protein TonB